MHYTVVTLLYKSVDGNVIYIYIYFISAQNIDCRIVVLCASDELYLRYNSSEAHKTTISIH